MKFHTRLSELSDRFDAFIIDLWGVLHDGENPYPGAVECFEKLSDTGKEIILLSNAPRRAHKAEEKLTELGFAPDLYDYLITSGELTYQYLTTRYAEQFNLRVDATTGQPIPGEDGFRYYYVGPEKDRDIMAGSPFVEVTEPTEANFMLVTGFDHFGQPIEEKLPLIEKALATHLPLYCANPDRTVVKQNGEVMLCAGVLAEWYEKRGEVVRWFGKPYAGAYDSCLQLFETKNKARIAAIGDSLHTDVAGANKAGIFSVFCAGGIHAQELGVDGAGAVTLPAEHAMERLCLQHKAMPNAVIPRFAW